MNKSNIVAIRKNAEAEARHTFANHVQSVAFSLTLSRQMIYGLGLVRDYWRDAIPLPSIGNPANKSPRILQQSHTYNIVGALKRRGLVWHDYIPPMEEPKDHQAFKLTRAGEMVCELLVEAGLMAPKAEISKTRKRA